MADIRLIVVTFNSENDILECIDSLAAQEGVQMEIVIVDNSSRDSTPALVATRLPALRLIRNPDNFGYAKGGNVALKPPCPEFVAFVNPDTLSEPGWVLKAVRLLRSNPKTGAVQPRIMLFDERTKLNSRGNEANFLFFAWPDGYGEPPDSTDADRRIAHASGCASVYRNECLERIGHFDESFFMYGEDTDLGIRLFLAGYDTLYCPDGLIYHKYEYRESGWKYQLLERNRLLILLKTYRKRTLFAVFPMIVISELGVVCKAFSDKWLTHKICSYGGVIKRVRILMKNRRQLQTIRVRSDSELISMLKGSVAFSPLDASPTLRRGNRLLERYRSFLLGVRL